MLREPRVTPGQIDRRRTPEINAAFLKWANDNPAQVKMSRQRPEQMIQAARRRASHMDPQGD